MNIYKMEFEGHITANFKFDIIKILSVILECTIVS